MHFERDIYLTLQLPTIKIFDIPRENVAVMLT